MRKMNFHKGITITITITITSTKNNFITQKEKVGNVEYNNIKYLIE